MAAKKRRTDAGRPERQEAGHTRGMRTPEAEHGEPAGTTATMEHEKKAMSPVPGARTQQHTPMPPAGTHLRSLRKPIRQVLSGHDCAIAR